MERHGRHRYYRLAGPHVDELLETMARLAPAAPVRSLRQGTRAHAVRAARSCYDHLAGQLGTTVMASLVEWRLLTGGDGTFDPASAAKDRLSSPGRDCDYHFSEAGQAWIDDFGATVPTGSHRPLIRYCVDWSEQRHHLAGALGAALLTRMIDLGWLQRSSTTRAVHVTEKGCTGLADTLGIQGT